MRIDELPLPKDHWKRLAGSDKGDPDAALIYEAVGRSISIWETLEVKLLFLYLDLIQSHTEAARRAYGSIISATGRRDAVNAAAESCFFTNKISDEDAASFKRVMDHIGGATGRRNDLAHGAVVQIENLGFFLCPAYYSTKKNSPASSINFTSGKILDKLPGQYRYIKADIDHFCQLFLGLDFAITEFWLTLRSKYPALQPQ